MTRIKLLPFLTDIYYEVNNMLSIAVCDDEIRECSHIAGQIKNILLRTGIPCMIKQYNNGRQLLQAAEEFDIIFLDIIMREMDGMSTAKLIRDKSYDKLLIFITADRQSVYDAFAVEAFDYLVKPVDDIKLSRVLQRAAARLRQHSDEFIIVNRERRTHKLFLDDVRYFEIRGRLIEVHGKTPSFSWYEQIGVLENTLRDKDFFRCHKSYLVNLKYVDSYTRQEAVLDNGERILIAKRRYEPFCAATLEYMRRNGGITSL